MTGLASGSRARSRGKRWQGELISRWELKCPASELRLEKEGFNMATDFYGELGVSRTASADEIKKAYRKLAAKLHPDKNPGDKKTETRFKAVNRAYQALGDAKKRALYDEFGEEALREGFNAEAARSYRDAQVRFGRGGAGRGSPGGGAGGRFGFEDMFTQPRGGGLGDIFGDLFQGARGAARGGGVKGSDIASEVTVDFREALRGAELNLTLQDGGSPITVRIPPGADDGDRLRVAGQGAPGRFGGAHGDLVLAIRVRPHPWFERRGIDLHLDLPITVGEAYRGAKVRIPTPEGDVTLTVPKRAQSGQALRLKGKGVRRKKEVGDLFVRFLVKLPDSESRDVEQAIDELERHMNKDVRDGIEL
jgi:curved DNA-binding protein